MSLFGNKLAAAEARNVALVALLATIGFEVKAEAEVPSGDSLKALISQKEKAAGAAAESALLKAAGITAAEGQTGAVAVTAAIASRDAQIALYRSGLEAAGVKLGNFVTAADLTADEKKDKTPEQIATAVTAKNVALVKDAIGTKAGAQAATLIATAGHGHAIATPAGAPDAEPITAAQLSVAVVAEKDDTKKWALFKQLQALEAKAASPGKN